MPYSRVGKILCALTSTFAVDAALGGAIAQAKYSFEIYGFAQADAIYDTNRTDPAWDDGFRPSKIPTVDGTFGSDGQASISVKQSRFGVQGSLPVENNIGPINFKFEIDMFGVGVDAGQTTIRLRHAYAEWGQILAGQTHSLFMDIETFPNVIDYWGPSGMVFYRLPQLRWTPYRTDNSHFAIAIERPGNDIDAGQIREFDPALGANLRNDEKLPDFTAQGYLKGSWGHVQLGAILRRVGFDSVGTLNNEPKGHQTGWGVNLGAHANVFQRDRIIGQVVYGEGIASYMNDGGTDLAPRGTFTPQGTLIDVHAKAVPLLGIVAYYDRYWSDAWSTSIGYSLTQVDNTNLQEPSAFRKGEYASINLLYTPAKNIMMGAEAMWGQRTDRDHNSGSDVRFQVSVKYSFGAQINL